MRSATAAIVLLMLAGCSDGPASDASADPPVDPSPLHFLESAVAIEPCSGKTCWEPSVAVDPQGRIFAVEAGEWAMSAGPVSPVAVSVDGGRTFTHVAAPPPLAQAPPGTKVVYGDIMVQTAPSGRLFWTAIVDLNAEGGPVLDDLPKARPLNWAIQVAWSDDAGETWNGNQELSGAERLPDRQWLAFDGDTVYMSYNTAVTGVLIARSEDGGSTWSEFIQVAESGDPQAGGSGPPVVDAAGSVLVPICNFNADATTIFRSSDGGRTFTSTEVAGPCGSFPMLAARGDDLALAVRSGADIAVAWSHDGGASFSPLATWGPNAAQSSPWPILLANGSLALVWYSFDGPSLSGLHVTLGKETPRTDVVVATVEEPAVSDRSDIFSGDALTHFAHGALTPDDRLVVTWVDGPRLRVATEARG